MNTPLSNNNVNVLGGVPFYGASEMENRPIATDNTIDEIIRIGERLKDKNLLVLTPSYPNEDETFIAETFVKYQVAELRQYFRKIIIIAPVFQSLNRMTKDKLCKNYVYDNVEVYYPRCSYIPIFWLNGVVIDNRLKVVKRVIEEHELNFDLIHAHFTWPSGYIGVKLKEKYRKPVTITIHENGEWFNNEVKMQHPLLERTWSGADALIRVNRRDGATLRQYNGNVCYIPNGFSKNFRPMDTNTARGQLSLPRNSKIIFSVGNLIRRKGFNHLIDAMEIICNQRQDIICFIGGAGPERKKLLEQIGRLGLREKVRLLGPVPANQLTTWMNACDIFVLPSLAESFGIVQLEAMACGKPVVATRNGGSEEIITSEDHGLLVEPANPKDLAEKILKASDMEWEREKIFRHVERYTWEGIAKEILSVYDTIL